MKPTVRILLAFTSSAMSSLQASIRPSPSHPSYWDFRGPCAPLIGGSSEDNLRTRTAQPGTGFALRWLKIAENRWIPAGAATLDAQSELHLVTPEEEGYWLAVLQQSEP